MNSILFDSDGLLRSGWRVAVFLLAYVFLAISLGTPAQAAIHLFGIDAPPQSRLFLSIKAILLLIPALLLGWICGRIFERLPFRVLGAAFIYGWLRHLVLGSGFGFLSLSLAVAIAYLFGGLRFHLNEAPSAQIITSLAVSFLVFAVASAFEEALFRGYILQTLDRSGFAWLSIILTSAFFGAVHLDNPDATLLSTANTVLAGIWFSFAYLKTRDLWFVWGLHLMWNWTQGSFFGIEVSGLTNITVDPFFKEIDSGPTWLTGETYGIEGGIACTIAIAVSIASLHFLPGTQVTSPATPVPPA